MHRFQLLGHYRARGHAACVSEDIAVASHALLTAGNTYVTHLSMLEIRYYVAASGEEPFAEWFAELDGAAAA
jgi:hypothetical protein